MRDLESFEPSLARIEGKMTEEVFDEILTEIPGEWYGFDTDALEQMLGMEVTGPRLPHWR